MTPQLQTILETASESVLMAYGEKAQMIKTCEEMGELATQLCKRLNNPHTPESGVIDEIADVLIMVMQMRTVFGPSSVDERVLFKLDRTLEFIRALPKTDPEIHAIGVAHDNFLKGELCTYDLVTGAVTKRKEQRVKSEEEINHHVTT